MLKIEFNPEKDLIFDLKVCEECKSCKRYGLTGCCPPIIGTFEYYKKLLKQYTYGKFYIEKFIIDNSSNWKELGKKSSLKLHNFLLKERQKLFNQGIVFNIILSGGSCKRCPKCSIPCKFPQFRAIPIEATGINVIETLKLLGISIKFPVKKSFYRIGAVLWS